MRENVVREFIEMSTAYAKDTVHVRKQFETSAEQTQHLANPSTPLPVILGAELNRDASDDSRTGVKLSCFSSINTIAFPAAVAPASVSGFFSILGSLRSSRPRSGHL
jgi:hypothetical protein